MADQLRSKIIQENPITKGLHTFRDSFHAVCTDRKIPCTLDALGLASSLLSTVQLLPVARLLPSNTGSGTLRSNLSKLNSAVNSDDFEFDRIKPLLEAALADHHGDELFWDRVYDAVTESTPPPRPIASSLQQTPWLRNTGSFANSSEHRKYINNVVKEELGPMYVDLRGFYNTYFGSIPNLKTASETFFEGCLEGSSPLFSNGWKGWPEEAKQDDRRPLAKPNEPIAGSVGKRKIDVGFVDDPSAGKDSRCHWSQILVPGELKSNPSADRLSEARLDLGRYAREVLAAQDTRRFVLGFTLCESLMRIWVFDRLGGIASEQFDINKDGLQFVSTILGFLWMSEDELGFDPTIITAEGQRFIEIKREGTTERLILDGLMNRARCVAGRATTCWKAHREEVPGALFVVKDSWQYQERDEEGELLREATAKGAVHMARYYHHETVQVQNTDDDVLNNVRKGLDITKATSYRQNRSRLSPSTSTAGLSHVSRSSSSIAGAKRSSHETGAFLPPSKRPCSTSPTKAGNNALPNRVHRRVIVSDWGIPIYKAASRDELLAALADCIEGHKSLRQKAGLLHRDISIGNLMVSKDNGGFLIDLDLAVKEQRVGASGAKGKTGTWAFMAVGALQGEQHSFMHDLESFFWVLFWICIHFHGPKTDRVVPRFDKWNYVDTDERAEELAGLKLIIVSKEEMFIKTTTKYFTQYYQPLAPLMNSLRKVVFPGDKPWKHEDERLYSRMGEILREGQEDLK
ncbi:hypothetical protein QBC40DRAFT_342334 [Triangularia verruculosa]|uniref:non-specific serine/threonine protein kinase n=1 Tax=Triangularia verruculosa TaxID=2587418 RepID=A0AAN7AQ49_9PEZI|nr:hypothetical protein QBC40DRAFT_342334 [Triangularia verruculosa]